jgi:hypothetical protein
VLSLHLEFSDTVGMDAQYPFASREDIWRVFEEVKDLYSTQLEHGERIARLERRREDDARLKSVWGPISQFPSTMSGPLTGKLPITPVQIKARF